MKSPDRVVWLNRGWYPLYFGFCPNEKAWKGALKKLGVPAEPYPTQDGRCTHLVKKDGGTHCAIVTIHERIDEKHRGDEGGVVGLIVHESAHVWQALCENIGEGSPSHEFEAYAMQHIAGQLYDAYVDTRRSKPKWQAARPKKSSTSARRKRRASA